MLLMSKNYVFNTLFFYKIISKFTIWTYYFDIVIGDSKMWSLPSAKALPLGELARSAWEGEDAKVKQHTGGVFFSLFPLFHPQKLKIQLKNAPDGSKNNLDVLY